MKKLLYGVLFSALVAFSGFSVIQASNITNGELLAMNGKCGADKCGGGKCGTSKSEGKMCNSAEKAKKYKECKAKCEDLQCFKKCMHGDKKGTCGSKGCGSKDGKSCGSKGCDSKKSKCGEGKCGGGKCGKA